MSDLEKLLAEATPGPWHTHMVDDTSIIGPDGTDVATTCDSSNVERSDAYNVEYERMEADARLIALAPSLAAALLVAEKALLGAQRVLADLTNPDEPSGSQIVAMYARCRSAEFSARPALSDIAKLRGDSK